MLDSSWLNLRYEEERRHRCLQLLQFKSLRASNAYFLHRLRWICYSSWSAEIYSYDYSLIDIFILYKTFNQEIHWQVHSFISTSQIFLPPKNKNKCKFKISFGEFAFLFLYRSKYNFSYFCYFLKISSIGCNLTSYSLQIWDLCYIYKRNQTTMSNPNLVRQIEYYLSEDNLQNDQFFYKQVASNADHFVKILSFLNCNKVKKLGVNNALQIIEAVENSQSLELNEQKTALRIKSLQTLPEFKPKKKLKSQEKPKESFNPYDHLQVVIYALTVDKEQTVPFRYIQEALLKNYNIHSPYVRFNKTEGNFAVNKKNLNEEDLQTLVKEGLKVGDALVRVVKADKEQLSIFWQKHGHHYNGIVDSLRKDFNKRAKEEKRIQAKNKKVQFKFGGKDYEDINKLKSEFKNILCRNPNNVPLKQAQSKLVKQLLQFHDNAEGKLKDLKHFVVDVHPSFMDTRCLFAVKQDGTRQDFSVVKCIDNIQKKYTQ